MDVFTRKAYAEPMKNKDIKTVCETFQKIINESGAKPRSIICDNDGAFTGELFQELCIKLKIALQPSIVSDHKSLGIIDNFARRIKRTITKIFLNTKSTVWYSQLPRIINLYNESPHSSIDDLTPEEAGAPKNFENIFEINSSKSIANEKFTDLNIGDKVRLDIRTQFTKGTDQAYSDKVYKVIKVDNRNITLDNEKSYKRSSLVKVPDSAKDTNISQPVQKAIKAKRVKTVLAREGLEAANIIKNKRNRPVVNYA